MSDEVSNVIEFGKYMGKLKHLPRTGWIIRDIPNCETVASHMYRMAMLTYQLKDTEGLDIQKCLNMCLIHDMAESIVGDITPHCGVPADVKHQKEEAAMKELVALVPLASREIMMQLFMEYENQESRESILVKDLDRFDLILQALEYEESHNEPKKLEEFFAACEGKFKFPEVQRWVAGVMQKRAAFEEKHASAAATLNGDANQVE